MSENPWAGMPPNTQRRIEERSERDLYWMTDVEGSLGFYIHSKTPFGSHSAQFSLKGIKVGKRASASGSDFFLVLASRDDWQIFASLCRDLISVAVPCRTEAEMIAAVEVRLKRWQRLLKSAARPLSVEVQIGLFGELLFLRDEMLVRFEPATAMQQWRGPDSDKQDFICDSSAVEIKSYVSSKGQNICVSSLMQMWPEKPLFYLVAYGLSFSDTGLTVGDLAFEILEKVKSDFDANELFEAKLGLYGYWPEITPGDLEKFKLDGVKSYEVRDGFPRISPDAVAPEITSVRYNIDLSRCVQFRVVTDSMEL